MSNGGKELVGARPAAVSTARAAASSGWSHHEAFQGFLWIAPAFLYLAFFIAYPFFMSLYLSVSSARVGSPESHFVGLQNYTRLFADPTFWQTVRNSFVFTLGSELIRLVIGLPLAFALNRSFKGKRVVQGIILIPFVIPIALSSLAWKWMFDSLYSVINWMLIHAHVIDYPWQWLGEPGQRVDEFLVGEGEREDPRGDDARHDDRDDDHAKRLEAGAPVDLGALLDLLRDLRLQHRHQRGRPRHGRRDHPVHLPVSGPDRDLHAQVSAEGIGHGRPDGLATDQA